MKKIFYPFLFTVAVLIASCTGDRVTILSFSPTEEVEEFTTFQVDFSEDIAPVDKIGEWIEGEFIEFEPAIQGKYKWLASNTLIFSPETPLKPGQAYTAQVSDKVLEGYDKKGKFEKFTFHTPYFDATRAEFFWTQIPRSDYKVTVQANLYFNYPVDPADISEYLKVTNGGNAIKDFKVVSTEASEVIAVNFGEVKQTEKDQEFEITIKSGLKSVVTDKGMTEDRTYSVTLDALTRLAITSVSSGTDGTKGWIEVFTTQAVDDKAVEKFLSLSPRKTYRTTTTDHSFRIEGAFEAGSLVNLTIKKGLPGLYGGQLEDEYSQEVLMADLDPTLEFTDSKGQYLMRGGKENIKVRAVNVRRANVKVYEVFANNILFYFYNNGGGYYYDNCCGVQNGYSYAANYGSSGDDYYEDEYYDYYDDYYYSSGVDNYGRLLHTDSVILGDDKNRLNEFTVNLTNLLDKRFGGIYVVEVRDERDYWRKDMKIVSVSDLGIVAKRSKDELLIYVNSISSAEPVPDVEVSLISSNNQALVTGKTDVSGVIHFKNLKEKAKGFTPRLITARKGDDFNFADFKSTEIGLSRFDVGGKMEYSDTYETFIYADRNLFRPGEKAHFNTIVRDKEIGRVKDIPVIFKVINPRGRIFQETKSTLDKEGSAELELSLPDYAETGNYTFEVYSGSKELMSSYSFSVEEFVPDKIRVEANAAKKELDPGEEMDFEIFSEYLFGAPCDGHSYEVDINMSHSSFSSEKYKDYSFHPRKVRNEYLSNDYMSGTLDETGRQTLTITAPSDITASGIIRAKAYVTVFDATGRTVTQVVPYKIFPNEYFIGIKQGAWYVSTGKPVTVSAVAVDSRDGKLSNFAAMVDVVRYEWRTVLKKNSNGSYYYQSERKEIIEETKSLTLNGPTNYTFTPEKSGQYEIRIHKRGEDRYTARELYAYGYSTTTSSSFQVDREGRIEIIPDKESYKPGETAKVLFKTPFSGKMLVTVEREKVMEHRVVTVENNSAELELPITGAHLPNVFVSATLYKAHAAEGGAPFFVGHGYQPLMVEAPDNRLSVEIQAPDRIKPRRSQEIIVKTNPEQDIYVTLAVVDEGILQIKNYKTPDPYGFMYAKRKLGVSSYDLYEYLMDEVTTMSSSVAGGDEEGAGKRQNPITAKRFKLLSFWSGTRRTNSSGEVRISVPIPQFNGSARIMAVAYSGKRFGAADKNMTITDDVVMMPAIPRFLSPNDSIVLPVSLMNTTTKSGKVSVTVKTEGPLKVSSSATQSVNIGSKGNENVKFGLQVANEVGKAKIMITTTGLDQVSEEIEIAVRPTSPLVVQDGFGTIKAGESKKVQIPGNFVPGTQNSTISISKFPALKFAGNLKYLVSYPHGCLEQTTSKLFPQLYFDDLAAAVAPDMYVNGNPVYFIKEGIRKLQSMQISDGSLAYWPGGSYTNWWSSTYAAHFLVEAKKAGYDVQESVLNRLLNYLAREAADKETYTYYSYKNGTRGQELKARKEALYSLYVLALADRADISLMNYYRARTHLLTQDARYLLAGSFALKNDWNAFNELMPEAFLAEEPERESGGNFDSPVRANAMILSILCDVDPDNKQIPSLIRYLTAKGRSIYSTQDKAWTFLALGKAASKNAKAKVKVDIAAGGKQIGTYDGQSWTYQDRKINGQALDLKASGTGSVYYFWSTEGVKAGGDADVPEVDNNIKGRRTYYTRDGREITNLRVKQGDLIVCKIELQTGIRGVQNLAVSDLIPAGFEIDNPRLGSSSAMNWMKTNMYPEYLDIRDDRLLIFTSMSANDTRSYHYLLRVVNAGRFKLAPLGVEAMYDPDFNSYHGAGTVRVDPK